MINEFKLLFFFLFIFLTHHALQAYNTTIQESFIDLSNENEFRR